MKITTQKRTKKSLKFYVNNYGFRKPFQVLVDGTICQAALKNKVNIREQFPKYLDGDAKLLTTQCVIIELEKIGRIMGGALAIVKQFGYHRCGHEKSPVGASKCLESMLGEKNESRYILATQDPELRTLARRIPGTPVIYLHGRTPVFEEPSHKTRHVAHDAGQAKFVPPSAPATEGPEPEPKKKRKKKGGPNSLSCKKKKKTVSAAVIAPTEGDEKKRKRKRVKLAKHLKEVKREWLGQTREPSCN